MDDSALSARSAEHPLSPLSESEIHQAVAIVRAAGRIGSRARFVSVGLREPDKDSVRRYRPGMAIEREAAVCVLDHVSGKTSEGIVSLSSGAVRSWREI